MEESFDDFKNRPFANLCGRRTQDGPHRLGRSTLLADDFSKIFLGNPQFQTEVCSPTISETSTISGLSTRA